MYLRHIQNVLSIQEKNLNPSTSLLKFKKQVIHDPGAGKMHERLDTKAKAINNTSVKLQK